MFGSYRTRVGCAVVGAAALVGLVLSCSSPTPPAPPSAGPISDVQVESHDGGTVIRLVGAGGSPYQADFEASPPRIMVSLPGTDIAGAPESSSVFDAYVQEVALGSQYDEGDEGEEATTYVEVSLSEESRFDVSPAGNDLVISVGTPNLDADGMAIDETYAPLAGEEIADDFGDDEGWVEMEDDATGDSLVDSSLDQDLMAEGDDFAEGEEWVEAAPVALTPATRLTAVDPEGGPEGTVIRIMADGMPSGVESFTLDNPARLVIDLPAIQSDLQDQKMLVGSPHVDLIRVGQHEDKVRVVIDAGSHENPFDERQISPVPNGLVIALGSGEAVDEALDMARAALSAPSTAVADTGKAMAGEAEESFDPEGDLMPLAEEPVDAEEMFSADHAQIASVDFLPSADADRVVIQSDRPVDYTVFKPDDETFVLLFSGATLGADASTQLLPEPGGPVSLVSAFAQPELQTPEVRLVVKRAAGLEPSLTQYGNEIVMGFERGQGDAQFLPVHAADGVAGAAGKAMAQADASLANDVLSAAEFEPAIGDVAPVEQSFAAPAAIDADVAVDYLQEGGLLDGKEYAGRRISLDFKEVDIRDVLRLIADVSDLNVIAGDEVQGNVTIRLVDVPWDQALDVILLTKGLGFVRVGNVLRIAPGDILKQEEEARLQERRAKEKLEDLVVKLQPVNYADVEEISALVKRLLTPRGSVDTDERTNTIIIKDIAAVIDEATALVKAIDTQTPQVMIEARIVEANLDFSREIGAEFGGGTQPNDIANDFNIGGLVPETNNGNAFPRNASNNVVFSNPITNTPTGLLNLGSFILENKYNVDFRLTAAELNGEGKVISSPRVVTLDNREALIEQGVSIPFQTFENGDAQLEFIDAVLQLKVTPHITADRSIIMSVEVSRNAPDSSVETPTGSPAIAKNQAKTETLVKDGQTLVIGGIYVIDKSDTESRVPYLWEMPVLGHIFKSNGLRDVRKELLIFVTPSVVTGQAIDASAG